MLYNVVLLILKKRIRILLFVSYLHRKGKDGKTGFELSLFPHLWEARYACCWYYNKLILCRYHILLVRKDMDVNNMRYCPTLHFNTALYFTGTVGSSVINTTRNSNECETTHSPHSSSTCIFCR